MFILMMVKVLVKVDSWSWKSNLIVIFTSVLWSGLSAQNAPTNLVPNGDFEVRSGCPNGQGDIGFCLDWENQFGSCDYFHICADGTAGGTVNIFGRQPPFSDSAYVGLLTYYTGFSGGQEILKAQLTSSLQAGVKYRVSFSISVADSINYATCCVGAILSDQPPPSPPFATNLSDVELIIDPNTVNLNQWYHFESVYTAEGGEDAIYLGSFRPDSESNPTYMGENTPGNDIAYMFIDGVSVVEDDLVGLKELEREVKLTFENGRLSVGNEPLLIEVLDLSGRKTFEGIGGLDVSGLSGLYIIQVSDIGTPVHIEKRVFVR